MVIELVLLGILIVLAGVNIIIVLSKNNSGALEKSVREEFSRNREEMNTASKDTREELQNSLKSNREEVNGSFKLLGDTIYNSLKDNKENLENNIKSLQEDNNKKLEEMRKTVDEKLNETLEKRFNESFKLISDRLEQVHKGLGEMQTLANGVGDLKKVLTNVKTRGVLGEIQLGAILQEFLSTEQYTQNARVKPDTLERVEFAIVLPDKNSADTSLLLPVDAKFPVEDYQRLVAAYEANQDIEKARLDFSNAVKKNAKDISSKYINPPTTTDFAVMFVPTEGLYAEILRLDGLFELLVRDFKIVPMGPVNLVAFLNSLQMGFRTLAIEKRSSDVWNVLGMVKTEFGKFGDMLDKTKKKLQESANSIEAVQVRSRAIERNLKDVQELPAGDTVALVAQSEAPEEA